MLGSSARCRKHRFDVCWRRPEGGWGLGPQPKTPKYFQKRGPAQKGSFRTKMLPPKRSASRRAEARRLRRALFKGISPTSSDSSGEKLGFLLSKRTRHPHSSTTGGGNGFDTFKKTCFHRSAHKKSPSPFVFWIDLIPRASQISRWQFSKKRKGFGISCVPDASERRAVLSKY